MSGLAFFSTSGRSHGQCRKFWQGVMTSTATTAAVTFSSVPIGTAYPDRYVVIAITTHAPGGSSFFYNDLTCNGVAMQWLCSSAGGAADDPTAEFYISSVPVPTGTTATIVCNNQSGKSSPKTTIGIWSFGGINNVNSMGFTVNQGNGTNIFDTSTTKEGGCTFGVVAMKNASVTVTWSGNLGFVKDSDAIITTSVSSFASVSDRPANANSFTVTGSTNNVGDTVAVISYIPG